jgi:hypothetical protein
MEKYYLEQAEKVEHEKFKRVGKYTKVLETPFLSEKEAAAYYRRNKADFKGKGVRISRDTKMPNGTTTSSFSYLQ